MPFAMFLFGLAVLVSGIAWALATAGIAAPHVTVVCLVIGATGIMTAVSRALTRDTPA